MLTAQKKPKCNVLENNYLMLCKKTEKMSKMTLINEIKNDIIYEVKAELNSVKAEISEYIKFETDPDNYFTIGSTKEDVKEIMGVPTSIDEYFDSWYYEGSRITFKNGKVSEYSNVRGNLRVK